MRTMDYTSEDTVEKPVEYPKKIARSIMNVMSGVSVEPTLFLTMFSSIMYQLVVQNLYLEKACRVEIRFNDSVCDAMTERNKSGYTQDEETEVQKMVSQMLTLRTFIQGSFPLIVVIFAGSWSDRHNRRKPLILFPIVGEIICCLLLIVNTIFFYELPLIFTTLGDSIPFALLGGWPCFNNGIYSYVGSKYKDEDKTMRLGIVTATLMSALLLGSSAGGFIYQMVGFTVFFSICIILFVMAFIIAYFKVNDLVKEKPMKVKSKSCKDLFGVTKIVESFKTSFKSGPNRRRCKIIVIILSLILAAGPFYGDLSMNYMYTRLKFAWNAAQFAVFASVQLFTQVLGSAVAVVLFSRVLGFEDSFLGVISVVGSVTSDIILALASTEMYYYIGACCDSFQMGASIATRSLMSKIVPPYELGQANSMLALADAMVPMVFGPIYSTVYKYTVDVFPGTYFFISAIIRSFGLGLFIWLYKEALLMRRSSKKEEKTYSNDKYRSTSEV